MPEDPALSADPAQLKRKNKKNKVRTAWISFVGRIVAQLVGAIASVSLGFFVLTKYGLPERQSSPPTVPSSAASADLDRAAGSTARRASGQRGLVVLPLQNYSKDASQAYFADGLTEALTTELTQVPGLHVTSRTSAMAYKASVKPLPQIARELDVDLVLEGSVVRDGRVVRVTGQLIDAGSDRHLWARSYDRPLGSVLPIQRELAKTIAKDITAALRSAIESGPVPGATVVKTQSGR